jgi:hypothetical protein
MMGGMGAPAAPRGGFGGWSPGGGGGGGDPFSRAAAMGRPAQPAGGMAQGSQMGQAMGAIGALSDEQSKTKIRELESELQRTYSALGGGSATGDVHPGAPDTAALDRAYSHPGGYSYDYKDPSTPGAAPGRQSGPMAHELKALPGVVQPGADGLDRVDTNRLSLTNASEIGNLRRELDALNGRIASGQSNPNGTY